MNIVVTGSIGFDYIMDFPGVFADRIMPEKIHQISLSFLVDSLKKNWGGTGGNIAYTLGLLQNQPILLASAGNDFIPYEAFLTSHGVNAAYITQFNDIATGAYFVITDRSDNQIGAFYTGAMRYAAQLSLKTITEKIDLVIIAANDPIAMKKYVTECKELRLPYLYDPAFQIDTFSLSELEEAVMGAHMLIGNDYEIELILKKLRLNKEKLLKQVSVVVTTLGSKGALIERKTKKGIEEITINPAKPTRVIDPTGAGDAFRAGFLAGLARGFDLQTCGQMGALAAVYTVEKYGTTTHTFTVAQFITRFHKNYSSVSKLSL